MRRTKLSVTIAMLLASRVSGAAEFTVNTTEDVVGEDNLVSLREAVMAASSNSVVNNDLPAGDPTGDSIVFHPNVFDGTSPIALRLAGPLTITDDLIIDGSAGGAVVKIDALDVAGNIFAVDTSEFVRLSGMDLVNGNPGDLQEHAGGALHLAAGCVVALTGMSISGNTATLGGGIYSECDSLSIVASTITGNTADVNGGGVHLAAGSISVSNSLIQSNVAGQEGGGLWNSAAGHMEVSGSTISGNTALIGNAAQDAQGGGGVFNDGGTIFIMNTPITTNVVTGNTAGADDGGGGVFNDGRNTSGALMALSGSTTLSNNTALGTSLNGGGGLNIGALEMLSATMTLSHGVRVLNNSIARAGGGIESINGILNISGVEISGNTAGVTGGGIDAESGSLTMFNTTISGNTADFGGGLNFDAAADFALNFSTVAENHANDTGGGIAAGGTGNISNSLFGHNQSPDGPDISGAIAAISFSLISDSSGFSFDDLGDNILNVDPRINTLADNGGPTLTHALLINSPAIDKGDVQNCPEFDQRGFTRPGNSCDIGAFEFDGFLDQFFEDGFEDL